MPPPAMVLLGLVAPPTQLSRQPAGRRPLAAAAPAPGARWACSPWAGCARGAGRSHLLGAAHACLWVGLARGLARHRRRPRASVAREGQRRAPPPAVAVAPARKPGIMAKPDPELAERRRRTDPLANVDEAAENNVWAGSVVTEFINEVWKTDGSVEQLGPVLKDASVMERLLKDYAVLATASQMDMLPATLMRAELADLIVEEGVSLDEGNCLDEPLNWRRMMDGPCGVKVFALDLYVWSSVDGVLKGSTKSKGFATGPSSKRSDYSIALAGLKEENDGHHWAIIHGVAEKFFAAPHNTRALPPKILLPAALAQRLSRLSMPKVQQTLLESDVHQYTADFPWPRALVSKEHCAVIVVLEAGGCMDDALWALPLNESSWEVDKEEELEGSAPIIVTRALQQCVKLDLTSLWKRLTLFSVSLVASKEEVEEAHESASSMPLFFTPFAGAAASLERWNAGLRRRVEAKELLKSEVAPLIHRAYADSWSEMRKERVARLTSAKAELSARLERRRAQEERAKALQASLEEAYAKLDVGLFQELAARARREGSMSEKDQKSHMARLNELLEQAEAPLVALVNLFSQGAADGDVHTSPSSLVNQELKSLEEALLTTQLQPSNAWRRLGEDLRTALLACSRLAAAVDAAQGEDSVVPSDLEALLARGEGAVALFESRAKARSALGREPAAGRSPLRALLAAGAAAATAAKRDAALQAALAAAPWCCRPVPLPSAGDVESLERRAAEASPRGRARALGALEAALGLGRCATALRQAAEGCDAEALAARLEEARRAGLVGLEAAERRWQELSELRASLAAAVLLLDFRRFEQLRGAAATARLPEAEVEAVRARLEAAVAEAEAAVSLAVHDEASSEAALEAALTATRLPAHNAWRVLLEAICLAHEAAARLRDTHEGGSVALLEKELASGALVAAELKEHAQFLGWPIVSLRAATSLQDALDLGAASLRGALADQALRSALTGAPWTCADVDAEGASQQTLQAPVIAWRSVGAADVAALQVLSERATSSGRARVESALGAALQAGQCALELRRSLELSDVAALAAAVRAAKELGLQGVEDAESHLHELRPQMPSRPIQPAIPPEVARQSNNFFNLIFLDLELTADWYAFDKAPCILEAAIIVTDRSLREKARGRWTVGGFAKDDLESLDEWHQSHFRDTSAGGLFPPRLPSDGGNGLFTDVMGSRLSKDAVEDAMLELVQRHCPPGSCPLVGYSVQCDREVLKVEMPRFYRHLSHQIIDISSFFLAARLWLPDKVRQWDKKSAHCRHRAMTDVEDSIDALRWIQEHLFQRQVTAAVS